MGYCFGGIPFFMKQLFVPRRKYDKMITAYCETMRK